MPMLIEVVLTEDVAMEFVIRMVVVVITVQLEFSLLASDV